MLDKDILLQDAKLGINEKFDPDNLSNNSFDLLMRSFVYHIETNSDAKDYENKENKFAHEIYQKLGWDDNEYFDVINSFWTTFHRAWYSSGYSYREAYKNGFTKKYVGENNEDDELHKKISNMMKEYPLSDFAAKCHCIANFMPCPGNRYNGTKGCRKARDYFPLMIDWIEERKNEQKEWHQWFIDNRKKYCLDDYYTIENGKLKGIAFFDGQTLNNPYPKNKEQAQECINEMLKRTYKRADLIIERYNEGNTNG